MLTRRVCFVLTLLLVALLCVGCGSDTSSDDDSGSGSADAGDAGDNGNGADNGGEDEITGIPAEYVTAEAASALPEPWMAFPDSMVQTDWYESGMSEYPAWLLIAPPDTTREEVIEYYESAAEERDDFEVVEVHHGVTGTWLWQGEYKIMIETDSHYELDDFVQITFAFEQDIE